MQITEITAGYAETITLPEYNNARPSLTITARLEPGDDPVVARKDLDQRVKQHVHGEVDRLLEAHGKAPKHYEGDQAGCLQLSAATGSV